MKRNKKSKKQLNQEEARELYHNGKIPIKDLAIRYGKSERTIYRWLRTENGNKSSVHRTSHTRKKRARKYPREVYLRITQLKKELPQRSASTIWRLIKKEYPKNTPAISTIRKYIREEGLNPERNPRQKGYVRFERKQPNDLWQIDIAGVQTVAHLGKLYLIALIDDHSRFVVAATYFNNQLGVNVLRVIRDAVMAYGRPNQILADNGTQFRNLIGKLGTKYSKLLESLGIEPIFARVRHPQTKGKLERWFGTVKQMFLGEARYYVKTHPDMTLSQFNQMLHEWVEWYNSEKPHRSLPKRAPPKIRYFNPENRIFRPLKAKVNWERWLHELERRKVTKYNEISYKSQKYSIPSGYVGVAVEIIEYDDKIEIYYRDQLIITHPYNVPIRKKRETRKITHSGVIMYKGTPYTIDYKLAGKTVEVQEINNGENLLVYLDGVLLKTLDL